MAADQRPQSDEELARLLRDACAEDLDPGAAERIAEGAWARAAKLQASGERPSPLTAFVRRPGVRRLAMAAGLVVAVTAATFALRGTDPALAVDGDPVEVLNDGKWRRTRRVAPGETVFVPAGIRTLTAKDGGTFLPELGSLFRVALDNGTLRIQVLRGGAEVDGAAVRLSLGDLRVDPDASNGGYAAWVGLDGDGDTQRPTGPGLGKLGVPRVRVSNGHAWLRHVTTGERLRLGDSESASVIQVRVDAGTQPHLVREELWSTDVPAQILAGTFMPTDVTMRGAAGLSVVFRGASNFKVVRIDQQQRANALFVMEEAMGLFTRSLADASAEVAVRIGVIQRGDRLAMPATGHLALPLTGPLTGSFTGSFTGARMLRLDSDVSEEMEFERNGAKTRLMRRTDGSLAVQAPDGVWRIFGSTDAAREAVPDLLKPFEQHLTR